ncbi:hypothetical protein ACWCWD_04965 [Streptomyces sp. NPDC001493]
MGWINRASDADLKQSMKLATEAAREARNSGNKEREAGFHEDLNSMVDEAQSRGWSKRSGR